MVVKVKICGITRVEDLEAAIESGADAIGLVVGFEGSPRNLSVGRAASLRRRVPLFMDAVLVTRFGEGLGDLISEIEPDAVQLYGEFNPGEVRRECCVRLIKPINLGGGMKNLDLSGVDAVLVDNAGPRLPGGTGMPVDWERARDFRDRIGNTPLILAGGLNPENVGEAVRIVNPYAVDVSSGVESHPGVKDAAKVAMFVRNAKGV